ncbi:MAG: L,D-transpeptidase [Polyangiaceae bacterium]
MRPRWLVVLAGAALSAIAPPAQGDALPPWVAPGDVPVAEWVRSVAPLKDGIAVYQAPGRLDARRGSIALGTRLPLFATARAAGCAGRWLNVGPLAWACSDVAQLSPDPVSPRELATKDPTADGMPHAYYFAGSEGAYGFPSLKDAVDDAPDTELEKGWAIAVVEQATAHGQRWGRSRQGRWFSLQELGAARPSAFHGEDIAGGQLDVAWVVVPRANVYSALNGKVSGVRTRFEALHVREAKKGRAGEMLRVSKDGEPEAWLRARDVSRATAAPPPAEVGGAASKERWIDVDLAEQVLVAYEGVTPVFATLVSTGRGGQGTKTATRKGVHRIWVKIFTTKMDNLEDEDAEHHYRIEDVPWVQFFDKGIGLHAAFWHRDFGHVHSHGCVNLAPLDAHRLFGWTGPKLPAGWSAAYPHAYDPGTAVRVR